MEETFPFHFLVSRKDVIFTVLSLLLFLVDIVLDVWAAASLYEEQKYICMALLIFILLASSVLQQIFSWLWYNDPSKRLETHVEDFVSRHGLMGVAHVFQLGVFVRFAALMEILCAGLNRDKHLRQGRGLYQNYDLSMLRLFEGFSESAPQLVLMMALIMEVPELHYFTAIKILGSISSLSFTMLSFHRSMRAFIPEKFKMGWTSSLVYFLWNLLLIGPRVACVSLFASVLPCYVAPHFLSVWAIMVLWAWWQNTDFMESKCGEGLYRATVGLIWYFSWFNIKGGKTKRRAIIYHVVMATDMTLLLGSWWWRRSAESARLHPLPINPYVLIAMLTFSYVMGLLLRLVYYSQFHPKQEELKTYKTEQKSELLKKTVCCKQIDFRMEIHDTDPENRDMRNVQRGKVQATDSFEMEFEFEPILKPMVKHLKRKMKVTPLAQGNVTGVHKRMRNTVANFYC